MNLIDFIKEYPDEAACKAKFKEYREQIGVVCAKCGCTSHYWKKDKEQYECRDTFAEALFGRLLVAAVSYKNEFRYKYG